MTKAAAMWLIAFLLVLFVIALGAALIRASENAVYPARVECEQRDGILISTRDGHVCVGKPPR
jgi:hypothetical protein